MVPPPTSPTSSAAQHTQQFLSSVLSQRGPSSLPYSEDVKWLIRQHLLSLSEAYPSLKPQTATFTHNDGRSVNLLQSDGTVPMVFQNVTYNIPVVIWLMETYPRHPPLVFVNPTRDMVIKRQHPFVNPSGSVSIPYLQNWVYPSSNLVDLARNLGNYFGSDPPLYSQRRPNPNPIPNQNPNPSPSFNASGSSASVSSRSIRPAIPPRTYPELQQKEPVNNTTSEVNILTTETSLLNLGSSHTEKNPNLAVSVSVPETSPLTLEVEGSVDKSILETGNNGKVSTHKGKKKIKEILKNADARGSTSDLYNAYKRPEEKKETSSSETIKPEITTKQESVDLSKKDVKFEPDDWEDAADISAPKLEQVKRQTSEDDNDGMTKKYSRDFLLKFSEQCTDLPEGFEVTTDVAEVLIGSSIGLSPHPSPRPGAGPRLDRRSSNVIEEDKWSKGSGQMGSVDKSILETGNKGKVSTPKGKKKIKEILKNADARGSTSDLYNAYKRPEEKKETSSSETIKPEITTKQESVDLSKKDVKFEPDDWEDDGDISAPKLEQVKRQTSEDDNDGMTKKYSRDFLLKFSEQCTDLPEGFEVTTDVAEVLIGSSIGLSPHPSPRPGAGPRLDRRSSNVIEEDKWSKGSGQMGSVDKSILETGNKGKVSTPKGKKKIKEILKNADARGSTSDLYNAYKRPEEKKETSSSETIKPEITTKQESVDLSKKDVKFEPDDWEDAADISAPKLEQVKRQTSEDDNDGMTKKYSRDFLLKFSEQCTDLPEGFEVTTDVAEVLIGSSIGLSPHPSPRPGADPRLDRRSSNVIEEDKWSKGSGQMGSVDKSILETGNKGKVSTPKGKKKIKEILKNADARGSTSDLYNAYKRLEEKKETSSSETIKPKITTKQESVDKLVENVHSDVGRLRKTREAEMEGMFSAQAVLRQREEELSVGLRQMQDEKEALEQQLQMVLMNTDVLEGWVRENEGKLGGDLSTANPDDAIVPSDSLSKQMLDCTASDLAIEDVVYALDKAVQEGSIPFNLYLRNVRLLSREQFFHRATSGKVRAVQMQAQVTNMASRAPPYGV